jgi:hypothetical protein
MKEILQTKIINLLITLKTWESCWLTTLAYLHHTALTCLHCIPLGLDVTFKQKKLRQETLRGPLSWSSEETNFLSKHGKHRSISFPLRVFHFITILVMYLVVHLRMGVWWNPSLHYDFLPHHPCSYCSSHPIELVCLVNRMTVEDEWMEPLT